MGHYAAIDNQKLESRGRVIIGEWVIIRISARDKGLDTYWILMMCFSGEIGSM